MSFRSRLALFFVLIVIVPMLAVAFLLLRLIESSATGQAEAAIAQAHEAAGRLFTEERDRAAVALDTEVGEDRVFTTALQRGNLARAQRRADQLVERRAIERIVLVRDGQPLVRAGDRRAIAPAIAPVVSEGGRQLGVLQMSVTDARAYVRRARALLELRAVVLNGERELASTLPAVDGAALPRSPGATVTVEGTEYRVQSFTDPTAFSGQRIRVFTLGSLAAAKPSTAGDRLFAGMILAGFFLLAIACAVLVSRTLQQQIAGFLAAARRLAGGDFSAHVPTVGRDEFAALGQEFNKMSRELEGRIAELGHERARVQDAMRRLGEALASSLDRDGVLELVVRTAVEGVGADAGRAAVCDGGELQVRSHAGEVGALAAALGSVETGAMSSGSPCEATVDGAAAIAHPLRGATGAEPVVGVVSIARAGHPFTAGDRELFDYLARHAARSLENVELHETAARESVTDELTGLANRRAFDDALAREVERARRLETDLGLVLIDLDDFKAVNDTHGHQQGDVVLREVARVLRDSSREIDVPARYGGEELAVVLPGTDVEGALRRAERVREQIAGLRIARIDGAGALSVTASCGVAAAAAADADAAALVAAADAALYEAKRGGKNMSVRAG